MTIRQVIFGFLALVIYGLAPSAYAVLCNPVVNGLVVEAPVSVLVDSVEVGQSLGTVTATPFQQTPWSIRCLSGGTGADTLRLRLNIPGNDTTNGIVSAPGSMYGLRVRYNGTDAGVGPGATVGTYSTVGTFAFTPGTVTLEVIKLRASGSRGLPGTVASADFSGSGRQGFYVFAQGLSVAAPTCTVSTSLINIPLGEVAGSSFPRVDSFTNAPAPQNIELRCSGSPRVGMTLQGTQAAGGPNTTVALTGAGGAGVAQGIGVQVLYGGNPLVVNSATPTTVSAAAGATLNVPVTARYYRTGNVVAGRANASPTLRFDYN